MAVASPYVAWQDDSPLAFEAGAPERRVYCGGHATRLLWSAPGNGHQPIRCTPNSPALTLCSSASREACILGQFWENKRSKV